MLRSRALPILVLFFGGVARAQVGAPPERPPEAEDKSVPTLTPPKLTQRVAAIYPPDAQRAGLSATVILQLLVDDSGHVAAAQVDTPAGHGFDEAALAAVRQFRFLPGLADGKPVPVRVTYRYVFAVQQKPAVVHVPGPAPTTIRLRGQITERGTRTPLVATLSVADEKGQLLGRVQSDEHGKFSIALPSDLRGALTVVVAASQHKPLRLIEQLRHDLVTVDYALSRLQYSRYESTVRSLPSREEIARVSLDRDEVLTIAGTKGDALAAVLNLPSVARSPFDFGQLVIRGSAPGESGAFFLGMAIPQAFHFGGLTSTFNSYLLDRFDLIPSNFSVRYGRLTGGLVDLQPRAGKTDRIHGEVKVDIYDAHAIVEGPVGKGSFALSVRRSYIDAILAAVLPSSFTVAPRYYDYQAMLDYPVAGGKLKIVAFGSDDAATLLLKHAPETDPALRGQFETHLWFHTLFADYQRKFLAGRIETDTTLAVGPQHQEAQLGAAARFGLNVIEADLRLEARFKLLRSLRLTVGLDLQTDYYWTTVVAPRPVTEEKIQGPLAGAVQIHLAQQGYQASPAVYAQAELKVTSTLTLLGGLRVDWFADVPHTYVQPRVMARWQVAEATWLKAGVGLFAQPPQAPYNNATFGNPLLLAEQAVHVTAGVETHPIPRYRPLLLELNLFYKDIRYVAVSSDNFLLRGNKIVPESYADEGIGRVYGADLLLKHSGSRWVYGWIAYTLLKSERRDHAGQPWRPFEYDQTHILTLVAGTHLPWELDVGIRFRYVTGNPVTPILAGVYDADHDVYVPVAGAPYSSRLPDFVQLDLRIDKRFIFKRYIVAVYIEGTNLTNRKNAEGYNYSFDYTRKNTVNGLPILPSIGVRATF